MLTFVVTGPFVAHLGVHAALVMADVLYFLVFILCFALGVCTRHHLHGGNAENI